MCMENHTRSDFNKAVVLNEDCVTGEIAMNYGRVTGMKITSGHNSHQVNLSVLSHTQI